MRGVGGQKRRSRVRLRIIALLLGIGFALMHPTALGAAPATLILVQYPPLVGGQPLEWRAASLRPDGVMDRSAALGGWAWRRGEPPQAIDRQAIRITCDFLRTTRVHHASRDEGPEASSYFGEFWVLALRERNAPTTAIWSGLASDLPPAVRGAVESIVGTTGKPVTASSPGYLIAFPITADEAAFPRRDGSIVAFNPAGRSDPVSAALRDPGVLVPTGPVASPLSLSPGQPVGFVEVSGQVFRLNFYSAPTSTTK